ncbi:hypothetical protein OGAPHI_003838 [Ogataea philodendri]|uniref:Uncharacterized protein n=1 Tax=Ogataea philodendri TaxID=1378263 RepID=A0A9P8P5Y5_9ASCO|nr:uncharacterized protein OGAPHI_003838 [Ogataea philodendri]KAH3665650.1 hypothetical protein OGAPHI_003838 [Ogataea philodendri]
MDPLEGEKIAGAKFGDKTVDLDRLRLPHTRRPDLRGHESEQTGHGGLLRTDKRPGTGEGEAFKVHQGDQRPSQSGTSQNHITDEQDTVLVEEHSADK